MDTEANPERECLSSEQSSRSSASNASRLPGPHDCLHDPAACRRATALATIRCGPAGGPCDRLLDDRTAACRSCQGLGVSLVVAGITGIGRSWTAWMISVLSIPRR